MKVFAITGLLGSGKSTAAEYLSSKGYPTVNVEEISRKVVDKASPEGNEGFGRVVNAFGTGILNSLGELDRSALAKLIMLNPHERAKLEEVLNPLIHTHLAKVMTGWKNDGVRLAFIEGSRIFETAVDKLVASVIEVVASEGKRVKRVMKRDSMGKDEVALMLRMQHSDLIGRLAKIKWKNDKSQSDLKKQIDNFVEEELEKARS